MKKSRLIQILKTFSPAEIREFEKFISSPYFGCKKFVVNFFKEIRKCYPEFKDEDIDREKIFMKLYENKKYNDGLIRRMTSDLIKMCEEFMTYNSFKKTDSFRNTCLLHELRLRKLNDMFLKKSDKILSGIEMENADNNSILNKFFVENQRINFFLKTNDKRLLETLFSSAGSLISFFLSALNNKTQLIHSRKRTKKADVAPVLYDNFIRNFDYAAFIKSIEKIDNKDSLFILANYYFNLLSINNKDIESYNKFRQIIRQNTNYFEGLSKYNYLITLSSFCASRILDNNYEYLDEYFYNINIVLNEELFLKNSSILSPSIIRHVILFSLMQKNLGYIENFIYVYSEYFNPEFRSDLMNYCYALLKFSENNFGEALEYSAVIEHLPPEFKRDIRILKIKIFYELNYPDSFDLEIDSFRHYLSSENSFKESSILKNKNFIKFILRLSKLNQRHSGKDFIVLKREIEKESALNEKLWLTEKVDELRNKSG